MILIGLVIFSWVVAIVGSCLLTKWKWSHYYKTDNYSELDNRFCVISIIVALIVSLVVSGVIVSTGHLNDFTNFEKKKYSHYYEDAIDRGDITETMINEMKIYNEYIREAKEKGPTDIWFGYRFSGYRDFDEFDIDKAYDALNKSNK